MKLLRSKEAAGGNDLFAVLLSLPIHPQSTTLGLLCFVCNEASAPTKPMFLRSIKNFVSGLSIVYRKIKSSKPHFFA